MMKSILFSFFVLLGLLFINAPAMAHGGGGIATDRCVANVGSYRLHFSAYQPTVIGGKELCWDLPAAGNTIIVFDLVEKVLRERPIEVRIVQHQSTGKGPASYQTLVARPVQAYPTGTIELETNFPQPGVYTAVVVVGGDRPLLFKVPISAALASDPTRWIIAGGVVVAIGALVAWYERRKRSLKKEAQA